MGSRSKVVRVRNRRRQEAVKDMIRVGGSRFEESLVSRGGELCNVRVGCPADQAPPLGLIKDRLQAAQLSPRGEPRPRRHSISEAGNQNRSSHSVKGGVCQAMPLERL